MLVLGRKAGEWIHVGSQLKIRVVKIEDGQVKLGFELPDHVGVLRGEIIERRTVARPEMMAVGFEPAK